MKTYLRAAALFLVAMFANPVVLSAPLQWSNTLLEQEPKWYASAEARAAADSVLRYQSSVGAWPKNTDLLATVSDAELAELQAGGKANTIDNEATTAPIRFLAQAANATGDSRYRSAVSRGLDYLLAAQYPNGGFPQFYPLRQSGYYSHITYNDGAMINALELLRDVAHSRAPFGFVDTARRERARDAVARGIDVILKTQIRRQGKPTAWCAQHDAVTLEPAWARAYEPPSLSGSESVGIVRFLMEIEKPTPQVVAAIEGAVSWFREVPIRGLRLESAKRDDGRTERFLVPDASAPPLWARFYELETNRPLYMDRDSKPRYDFSQIGYERRSGYSYHGTWPAELLERHYPDWRTRIAGTLSATSVRAPVIIDGDKIGREERPHGEVGLTTVHRYTDGIVDPAVILRSRTFHVGAEWGSHEITHDQVYYVQSGEGELISDGASRRLSPGMAAYVFEGSVVSLKQIGNAPLAVIMAWSPAAPARPAGPRPPVVLVDGKIAKGERPHGGVGMSTAYRYSDFAQDRAVHFRRRTLLAGSEIVEHAIPWDQGYYVLEGEATMSIDEQAHALQPGMAVYAYKNSKVRIVPRAGGTVSYLLIEPITVAMSPRQPMRVSAADIGRSERPPHNGTGDSTSFTYTNLQPGLDVELRKRILKPGASIGDHHLGQDQVFLVLEGEIEFVADGRAHRLGSGAAFYGYKGSSLAIRQFGMAPATYLAAWSTSGQP